MKYLSKTQTSTIIANGWTYEKRGDRARIRSVLLAEQQGFCAYTERYVAPIDALEIEHFDDRLKKTDKDNYWNWYAVHRWVNQKKRRIENFLPIAKPHDENMVERIEYANGSFSTVQDDDIEAENLINFLGFNDPTLADYRNKHVARLKHLREELADDEIFTIAFANDPHNQSFKTVLEAELSLTL